MNIHDLGKHHSVVLLWWWNFLLMRISTGRRHNFFFTWWAFMECSSSIKFMDCESRISAPLQYSWIIYSLIPNYMHGAYMPDILDDTPCMCWSKLYCMMDHTVIRSVIYYNTKDQFSPQKIKIYKCVKFIDHSLVNWIIKSASFLNI